VIWFCERNRAEVNRKRAHGSDPEDGSAVPWVKHCGIHVHSSKEEDTPLWKNLGRDHEIAVNKELVEFYAAGQSARRWIIEYQQSSNSAQVFAT
jgi:hypothetical protein